MASPRNDCIKINSDAQFDVSIGKGFPGIICRNSKGEVISGFTSKLFAPSTLVTEALALREVVSSVANLDLFPVIFESNCLVLVEMCIGDGVRREIEHIVKDIQSLRVNFTSVGSLWVNQNENMVADLLTKLASPSSLL